MNSAIRLTRLIENLNRPTPNDAVMEGDKVRAFTFETLMNLELRKKLFKRDVEYRIDSIVGYKEINTDTKEGEDFHTIIPYPDEVRGHVLLLTPEELSKYDWWEDQYDRKQVTLKSGVDAFAFILSPENIKDYGDNSSYSLTPDDVVIISKSF